MSKDGGPAFPIHPLMPLPDGEGIPPIGMSLRDYFAIHVDQPGRVEIAALAGVETKQTTTAAYGSDEMKALPDWDEWYRSLSPERRAELYARVRYQFADAMLKAREL